MNDIVAAFPELPLLIALACAALFLRVIRAVIIGALVLLMVVLVGAVVVGLLGFSLATLLLH